MIDRRRFLGRGFGALALGLLERQGLTRLPIFPALCPDPTTGAALLEGTDPMLAVGTATTPRIVDGLPFEPF